jgi:hypothetical protein
MAGLPRRLLKEFFVSQVLADSDVPVFSAELQDLIQKRVIAFFKLSFEAYSSGLHPDLKHSVAAEKLIETELFAGILFKDIPVLDQIYQFVVTLKVSQAENKKYLSPKSQLGF